MNFRRHTLIREGRDPDRTRTKCAGTVASGKTIARTVESVLVSQNGAEGTQWPCRRKLQKNRVFVDIVDFLKICSIIFKIVQIGLQCYPSGGRKTCSRAKSNDEIFFIVVFWAKRIV